MFYIVYKITNNINGKTYIGAHKTQNINDGYMGSGKLIKRAISKYGEANFIKEILFVYDNAPDMFNKEAELVTEDFIKSGKSYNLKIGGEGGFEYINNNLDIIRPPEKRIEWAKLGRNAANEKDAQAKATQRHSWLLKNDSAYAKKYSDTKKRTAAKSFLGKHHTEETKRKIGQANSKYKGPKNSQYGTCWVYSLQENRNLKIQKDELDHFLKNGWIKGRKIKFK